MTLSASFFHYQTSFSAAQTGQETNQSLILLPIIRLCVQHSELTLSPLSVAGQDALSQVIRLINANQQSAVMTFLSGVIGGTPMSEISITLLALKICLRVSNEGRQRMTQRVGTPVVSITKSDKVL